MTDSLFYVHYKHENNFLRGTWNPIARSYTFFGKEKKYKDNVNRIKNSCLNIIYSILIKSEILNRK